MKKMIVFIIIILILGTAFFLFQQREDAQKRYSQKKATVMASMCTSAGGNYLAEFNECEMVNRQECADLGGTFKSCESACRHDPDAEVCTQQCIQVCEF